LNFDVPSPAKGKSQDYRLIAVNSIGDSLPSAVARVSTPASVASAPFSLSGSVLADGRVQLSWSTPLDDGGAPVVGYRIEALRSGVWTFATSTRDLTSSGFVIAKGTSVSYRVLAQNSAGLSVPSNAIDLVREATAPGEVRNFSAAISSGIIRLTWGAPNDDGGTPILGYRVEQRIGQQWTVLLDQTQSLSHEVAAGSPGALSAYRVFAITRVGVSATASERTVQVPFLQASEPLSFSAVLEGNRIRFAWNAPVQLGGSTLSGYVIASAVSGSPFRSIANLPAGATSLVWAGANPGTEIQFRIAAATIGAGTGAWSLPILLRIPAVAPSDPNALTAQVRAGEGVLLTWTAPSSDGGSPILDYRVEVRRSTGWALLGRTAGLSYLAPLGVAGEILQHRVVAINAIGSSPGIRSISSQMGIAPATAPQSLSAAISSSRLVLTWSAPDIMGGTFNFYEVQVLDAGVFRRLATTGGTSITTALPAPGASVSFRVVAVTNAGVGAFTDALVFTSPKQVPGQPSAFTMSSNGKNVTFNWGVGSSGGGTLANAILYREVSGSWVEVMRAPAQAGTATFANELFGQLARYSLRISNEVGESSGSTTFSLRHAVIATSKPLAMSLTRQVNGLLLSWQNPEANGGAQPSQAEIQSSVDGQTWTRVALIRWSNSALVALPQKGRAVSYRVVAINPAGPSEPSDAVRFDNPLTAPMGNIVVSAARSGNSVLFRVTAPADFGGYSEASLSIERTGSLAFIASGETRLTRPLGLVTVTLPLPSARGTYTYRILITNPSGVLEQTVTFTF
ncbi:MAG: hypothetical protein EBS38_06585, partial [Actinobacteria bacterium]|nr:hypothetical protein [Actinomycetota bacterium]